MQFSSEILKSCNVLSTNRQAAKYFMKTRLNFLYTLFELILAYNKVLAFTLPNQLTNTAEKY
jgi:hypothetical protein